MTQGLDAAYAAVWAIALSAAKTAALAEERRLGPENSRGFDCGFAWIEFRPATNGFVRWLKANGTGDKGWNGGWHVWDIAHLVGINTQSISTKRVAAQAALRVILDNVVGLTGSSVGSRYD
jgi:hypothetical protein